MSTVHLHMMELERDGQLGFYPSFAVFPPNYHWVAELVGVLVDDAIQFCLNHCRSADDHIVIQKDTFATVADFLCHVLIILGKLLQVMTKRDVTRIYGATYVLYDDIDGKPVILIHLPSFRQ